MIKVTNRHRWENTKDATAYIGWFGCTTYYSYRFCADGMFTPNVDLPAIIIILSVARMMKILIKEG